MPLHIAVAWSGGADSTALLLALKQHGHHVVAWHVDHGWCEQSAQDARSLKQWAHTWHIPFFSYRLQGMDHIKNESRSRTLRYQQFFQWGKSQGIQALATAHHADDQAETVCMRLLQGAGSRGCQGISYQREIGGMQLFRPLLHISKQQLIDALVQAQVTWIEDSSNQDTFFLRNHIRHQLFPSMCQYQKNASSLFIRLGEQVQCLNHRVEVAAQALVIESGEQGVWIAWQPWSDLNAVVRAYVLRRMFERLFEDGKTPGRRHFELVERWMRRGGQGGLDLSGSRLFHQGDLLHLRQVIDKLRGSTVG